jgi:uncharacterized membrane protein YgdD (TMEM256/DUF423 family)
VGALLAGLAVVIGAFGAHWLSSQAPKWYDDAAVVERMLSNWEVGVRYQMYSAIGLVLIGLWGSQGVGRRVGMSSLSLLLGTAIFSGCLYLLVVTGQRFLGAIVPIGGLLMIVGWLVFAYQAWNANEKALTAKGNQGQ